MSLIYQCLATGIASYLYMSMGLMFAWPSSTLQIFRSANTTLNRPMGETELALFGSLASVGALLSTPIAGYCMDKIGRKYSSFIPPITHVIAWSLVALCNKVEIILLAIFIAGAGGPVFLIVPVYISEICQESIRGTMTSGSMIFYVVGFLISYLLGGCVEYKTMIYICLSMAAFAVVLVTFLKESPVYLMKNGWEEEAVNSIAFYRHAKPNSKVVLREIANLRRAFNPNLELDSMTSISSEEQALKPTAKSVVKLSLWAFIKKSRSSRQAMMVTLTLATASIFQGLVVIQVYAEPLFAEAVPTMSSTLCSVLLAAVTIVSGLGAAYLTDAAGRRPLMIYASIVAGLCCVVLGTQLQLHWAPHWATSLFIYIYCAAYTLGAGTVPYVLVAEVFLPEVKSFMSMFVIEWAWICCFVILFIFNPLVAALGLGPVFYFFASVCFLSAVFSAIYQPETKGLPVDAIQMLFSARLNK